MYFKEYFFSKEILYLYLPTLIIVSFFHIFKTIQEGPDPFLFNSNFWYSLSHPAPNYWMPNLLKLILYPLFLTIPINYIRVFIKKNLIMTILSFIITSFLPIFPYTYCEMDLCGMIKRSYLWKTITTNSLWHQFGIIVILLIVMVLLLVLYQLFLIIKNHFATKPKSND